MGDIKHKTYYIDIPSIKPLPREFKEEVRKEVVEEVAPIAVTQGAAETERKRSGRGRFAALFLIAVSVAMFLLGFFLPAVKTGGENMTPLDGVIRFVKVERLDLNSPDTEHSQTTLLQLYPTFCLLYYAGLTASVVFGVLSLSRRGTSVLAKWGAFVAVMAGLAILLSTVIEKAHIELSVWGYVLFLPPIVSATAALSSERGKGKLEVKT